MGSTYNQKISKTMQRRKLRRIYLEWKKQGCYKCGFEDPRAIDAHHTNESEKRFAIQELIRNGNSVDRFLSELAICKPMCRNCHAIHHHEIGTWKNRNDKKSINPENHLPGFDL